MDLFQDLGDEFRSLRPAEAVFLIDDKERHGMDPQPVRLLDLFLYPGSGLRIQQPDPEIWLDHPMFLGDLKQDLDAADILSMLKIGSVNMLDDLFHLIGRCELDQEVREHCVWSSLDNLKIECEPHASSHFTRRFEEMLNGKPATGLPVQSLAKIHTFRRDRGIQKEGFVFDGYRLTFPILQRPLQLPLSYAAERSDGIVINSYMHHQNPWKFIATTDLLIVLLPGGEDRRYAKPG